MRASLLLLLLLASCAISAQDVRTYIPEGAQRYAPLLAAEQNQHWKAMPQPWTLGGLVEQESCISLRHSKCWNPRAELKTAREYGFGFGQITVAYRPNGTVRFDKFAELRAQHHQLHGWTWDTRYEPEYQLRAIVLMTLDLWRRIPPSATVEDHLAFMLSSYNGGLGSVLQDRRLCSNTPRCDSGKWFGNVETTSMKSRQPNPGYGGRSWFEINRSHVRNVMTIRRDKYKVFWNR